MERLYELCKWSHQSNAIIGLQISKMENFREVCIAERLCSQVYEIFIITFIMYDFIRFYIHKFGILRYKSITILFIEVKSALYFIIYNFTEKY